MTMTQQDKKDFLLSHGWGTWYNENYWVHEKTVKDKNRQDYTNYGLSLDDAYRFEVENHPPYNGFFMGARLL